MFIYHFSIAVKGGGSEGGGAQDSSWDAIHVCNH